MHDLKFIRENPDAFDAALKRRHLPAAAQSVLEIDKERRAVQTQLQELQASRNDASKKIGEMKRAGQDTDALMAEVAASKDKTAALESKDKDVAEKVEALLATLPNIPADDAPHGASEKDNTQIRTHGDPPRLNSAKEHYDIGEALGLMDFETAAKLSGSRFTLLKGQLAQLERALANFMLDTHVNEHGYTEMSPPLLVRDEIMYGTGQLPKFQDDQFKVSPHDLWLIPTAEVPLTNIVNNAIIDDAQLPLRFVAKTACFRAEAGAAGRDTRGMLRQHQFYKVELVSITTPEQSNDEHERMTASAEAILKKLGLPFRTMLLCTGDMGFAARKTYDIEVWLPGQNAYREISSCSNCGDFQARRMKARFRKPGDKNTHFLHTLNGSGVAVGRCLIAVLENNQQPDGSVLLPEALRPYMGNKERITPIRA